MTPVANIEDYRLRAQQRLPHYLFEYIEGGSQGEQTLAANTRDFQRINVCQRVMRDVSELSTAMELFGQPMAMPLVMAPVGLAGMYARRGEAQAAQAARDAGVPFCLSSVSICGLQEVSQAAKQAPWFQLYMIKDRDYMRTLLQRVATLGSPVLVFTVDLPVPAPRYRDTRSGFAAPPGARRFLKLAQDSLRHPAWMWDVMLRGRPHAFGNFVEGVPEARALHNFGAWVAKNYEQRLCWDDIAWIRSCWKGPIVVKGVLDARDADDAISVGVDGLVVSNHGGRQLDGAPSTVSALPAIAERVASRVPVLLDGGIRSGLDIFKAKALGADACMIGRAWAYGLAADGRNGVAHVLQILRQELRTSMALTGCTDIRRADRSMLARIEPS